MELQLVREDSNTSENGVPNTRNSHAPTLVTTTEPLKSKLPEQQPPRLPMVQPNYYTGNIDENNGNIFDPRTVSVLNNQTSAESLPRPPQLLPNQTDQQRKLPEKLFLEYTRIAKSTEEKLDSEQEDTACLNIDLQREDAPTGKLLEPLILCGSQVTSRQSYVQLVEQSKALTHTYLRLKVAEVWNLISTILLMSGKPPCLRQHHAKQQIHSSC